MLNLIRREFGGTIIDMAGFKSVYSEKKTITGKTTLQYELEDQYTEYIAYVADNGCGARFYDPSSTTSYTAMSYGLQTSYYLIIFDDGYCGNIKSGTLSLGSARYLMESNVFKLYVPSITDGNSYTIEMHIYAR